VDAPHHEVDTALAQLAKLLLGRLGVDDAYNNSGMSTRKLIHDRRHEPGCHRFRASNSHLSDARIGQEIDLLDALPEFVERDVAVLEQSMCVDRGLDASGAAVKQTYPKHILQAGNRFRYRRLGHPEVTRPFGHTAPLYYR
jgi:hypothetical protein